jgi:hypothetical protein
MEINPFSHQGAPKSVIGSSPMPTLSAPAPDRWGTYVTLHVALLIVQGACVVLLYLIGAALDIFLNSGTRSTTPPSPSPATPLTLIDVLLRIELLAVPVFTLYAIFVPLVRRRTDWASLAGSLGIIAALVSLAFTSRMVSFVLLVTLVYLLLGFAPFIRAAVHASARREAQ